MRDLHRADEAPGPHGVRTFDELAARLRLLLAWAGLGYHELHRRVVELRRSRGIPERLSYNTVYRCLQPGRRRLDVELIVDIARVLLGDDAAAGSWRLAYQVVAGQVSAAGIVSVSAKLPNDLAEFTGRRVELARVLGVLGSAESPVAPIFVIDGMPGVGKSALAVHAGHHVAGQGCFAEVQLWVDLRGYDPGQPPADPSAVLDAFLRVLGASGDQIYHLDLAGRSARYRQLLAGRRALIVLDNAATEEQVRPLLPDTSGCLTLITSRRALASLPGAQRVRLDVFSEREALELLRVTVGADRIAAAADTAARIAALVGYLPLALGLVAGRINDSPDWTLTDHLARLAERRRQRQLDEGVEWALDLSFDALRPQLRAMVRRLSLHPGGDFDVYAAAALADADVDTARRQLDELVAANLLLQPTSTRYRFHDLVGVYAGARAVDGEPGSGRRDALTRLFDNYLYTASLAIDVLYPFERRRRPQIPTPPTPVPPITGPGDARAWLAAEHPNLLAAVAHTAGHGWPTHTVRFSLALRRHVILGGQYGDALTIHRHALDAARGAGDRAGEAIALTDLGGVYHYLGQHALATDHARLAVDASREVGDRLTEGLARGVLGLIARLTGRYASAIEHYSSAIAIYRDIGDRSGEGRATGNLAEALRRMGRHDEAVQHYERALGVHREVGDRVAEGIALGNLSLAYARRGRRQEARDYYHRSLAIHREVGSRAGVAHVLSHSGAVFGPEGYPQTIDDHEQSVAIASEINDPALEAMTRNRLGETLRTAGRCDEARCQYEFALGLARDAGERYEQARAHDGLAHTLKAAGRTDDAGQHWRDALALYSDIGVPEADEVRRRLAALPPDPNCGPLLGEQGT